MSPLWRDEVDIYLSPRKLELMRMGRGLKPRLLAEDQVVVEAADYGTWAPVMAALGACLAEPVWRTANARVVLSDHWARYAIVPWSEEVRTYAERLTRARYALEDVYGDLVAGWTVSLSDSAPGTAPIASAVPTALLAELRDLIEHRGLRVVSLQPQLIAAFNRWRGSLPASGAWFVSIEEGSLAAARLAHGSWDRVHVVRIGRDWQVELKRLQTFGRLASARPDEGRVYVDAPAELRYAAGVDDRGLEWLGADATPDTTTKLACLRRLRI